MHMISRVTAFRRRGILFLFLLSCFLLSLSLCSAERIKRILYIDSYNSSYRWEGRAAYHFGKYFHDRQIPVSIDMIMLNTHSSQERKVQPEQLKTLENYLQKGNYDLVVTVNDAATNLFLDEAVKLPPQLPLVFCGYSGDYYGRKNIPENITGLLLPDTNEATIRLGLKLFPQTESIAVITDAGTGGANITSHLKDFGSKFEGRNLILISGAEHSTPDMLEKLKSLPEKSIVVLNNWFSIFSWKNDPFTSIVEQIRKVYKGPILNTLDNTIVFDTFGGVLSFADVHGTEAAELAEQVLRGSRPESLPPKFGSVDTVLNHNRIVRFNIPESAIPAEAVLLNKTLTSWEKYRIEILLLGIFLFVILLTWLVHVRSIRMLHQRSMAIYQALPMRIGVLDEEENVLFCHTQNTAYHIDRNKIKKLKDIESIDYEKISGMFKKAFHLQRPLTFDYDFADTKRVMKIAPLPKKIFGKEVVAWVSHDNSEVQQARMKAEELAKENTVTLKKLQDTTRLWNLAINALPLYFFVKDADHDYQYILFSNNYCQFLKHSRNAIEGKTDFDFFPRETAARFREQDIAANKGQKTVEHIETIVDSQGRSRHFLMIRVPFQSYEGKRLLLGSAIDITEREENKRSLETANNLLNTIINALPFYFFAKDSRNDFRYILYNSEFERLVGKTDLKGKTDRDLFRENDAESFRRWDERVMKTGSGEDFVETILDGNGRKRYVHTIKKPFLTADGVPMLLGAGIDITEQENIKEKENESRMLLQALLDYSPFGVIVKDADHAFRYVMCNPTYCEFLGMTEQELIGKNDHDIPLFAGHSQKQEISDLETMASGKNLRFTDEYIIPGHGRRVYEKIKIPIHLKNGRNLLLVTFFDTTRLNQLIENERIINLCLEVLMKEENIDQSIHETLKLISAHMNSEYCYLLKYDYDEMTAAVRYEYASGAPKVELVNNIPVPLRLEEEWYQRLLRKEIFVCSDFSNPVTRKEMGVWIDWIDECHIKTLFAAGIYINGKLWGNMGLAYLSAPMDFSSLNLKFLKAAAHLFELVIDRGRSHEQLLHALKQAQDASKAKSFFLASVSHEIRTPLNAVIGFSELLRDETLSHDTQMDYLKSIAYAGNSLLMLINDVLDLSKLEADQMVFRPEKTDFPQFCREVCDVFRQRVQEKHLNASILLEPMPLVYIDKQRVRQVLFNLVGNAVKFTTRGSVVLKSQFQKTDSLYGSLIFQVEDTGSGIEPEDQKALFEPFVQAKSMRGTYAANNGTGLGLPISKRMVEQMGGTITLTSKIGEGSCFSVCLNHVRFDDSETLPVSEEPLLPAGEIRKGITVLLVDDVKMNLKVLDAMLKRLNIRTLAASSAHKALELLKQHSVDMILTDLWMPGMNGAEMAAEIRKHPEWNHIRLIAVSADIETTDNFDMTPFAGIITKPLSLEKLKAQFMQQTDPGPEENSRG